MTRVVVEAPTRPCYHCPDDRDTTPETDEAVLVSLLALEIFRDGGRARVNTLRDHDDDNVLGRMLQRVARSKLLTLLESHPATFHVLGRSPPHLVALTDAAARAHHTYDDRTDEEGRARAAVILEQRICYVLRQRSAKLARRHGSSDSDAATVPWLVRKVAQELHAYTRLLPARPVGLLPWSDAWCAAVPTLFVTFLEERSHVFLVVTTTHDDREGPVVSVVEPPDHHPTKECCDERQHHVKSLGSLEEISERVREVLDQFAPPVGGMDVGKLLTDQRLRTLLGGRDFLTMRNENPALFIGIQVFQDENRSGQWYVAASRDTTTNHHNSPAAIKNKRRSRHHSKNLLMADDVGTYSLTKPRMATAMANMLFNSLVAVTLGDNNTTTNTTSAQRDKDVARLKNSCVCLDLTAGVGGNTIALAKTCARVFAYELDPTRARYLRQNLDEQLDSDQAGRAMVACADSMHAITQLTAECLHRDRAPTLPVIVMVDPPFGGIYYRRQKKGKGQTKSELEHPAIDHGGEDDATLALGKDMPLTKVVSIIAHELAPVILGLKLPLQFDVASFLSRLTIYISSIRNKDMSTSAYEEPTTQRSIKPIIVTKLDRQLFVVLDLK